ncbi:MAG: protein kinase [Candidatus Bathyarchaeota archaeon]|nr:protein kinase [Candidatus Bathyarchaeota archaeon]
MKCLSIRELAQELNVDESAISSEIPEVIKQLQNKKLDTHYLVNNNRQSAKVVVVDKADLEFLDAGHGKLGFTDLVVHFGVTAKDINWLLSELMNRGTIGKALHDYYTEVKNKPSLRAWFEPGKVSVGERTILNIEVTCPCEIVAPRITTVLPHGLELEEEPKLPSKIFKGKFTGKYQYNTSFHGHLPVAISLGGVVEGINLDSKTTLSATLEVMPLPPELVVLDDQSCCEAFYQEPFRLVLDINNRGLGTAQNTELRGLEKYSDFEVLEPTKIGNVASHGSVKFKVSLKPKRSGTTSFDELVLYYEDLLGIPFSTQVPAIEVNVMTPKPKLKVELFAPEGVAQKRVFPVTVRISNIGEGDAKNVHFNLPIDPKLIQSGIVDCNLPRLKSDETEEIVLRLQAPDDGNFVIPDFDVELQDVEETTLVEHIFGLTVAVHENGTATGNNQSRLGWPFKLNHVIGGQYRIVEDVGAGGFAKVYRVRRAKFREEMALKALKSEFVSNLAVVERFIEEAKLTSDLREDHIVSVRQVDIENQGDLEYPYIIMEYLNGGTLRSRLASGEPIELLKCTEIMNDLCLALSYAHQHGVAHFDIKPSNIFYDNKKKLWKLGDFGLAKAITIGDITAPRGSLPYMAPEMREGKGSPKSDLYSLGVVFREILTGELNGDLQRLQNRYSGQVREELKVYVDIVEKMLSPKPMDRPSIRELLAVFSSSKTKHVAPKRRGS